MLLSDQKFMNYPPPKEIITTRPREKDGSNPVLSGFLLSFLAKILAVSSFIQKFLYRLNKFDQIKNLPEIDGYAPRYDPTVIPIATENTPPLQLTALPTPNQRQHQKAYYTVGDYHEAYRSQRTTPTDVIEFLLPLITREPGKPPSKYAVAYVQVRADLVRAAAQASTARYAAGKPLSPIDGVPVAVKDEVDLAGYKKSLGSALDFTNPKDETAWCVAKWEEAGAIIIGKTNMHELGLDTTNNNPTWGTPLNPHNPRYYTGGSSGGSACTVAQGLVPIALGVDGGGSIRLPSSFCGLWGLKPSQNRVSDRPTKEGANTVAVSGPMCANIDDLALAYRIMAQPDPQHPQQRLFPNSLSLPPSGSNPAGLTTTSPSLPKQYIGIDREWLQRSDPEILEPFHRALTHYTTHFNCEIIDISVPLQQANQKAFSLTILVESLSALRPSQIPHLTPPNQLLLTITTHASALDTLASAKLRALTLSHLSALYAAHPRLLILTPTTPCAGWKIRNYPADIRPHGPGASDADSSLRSMEYTYFANWAGLPAITCPLGYTAAPDRVPFGIMAVGEWGAEEQLIAFARGHAEFLGKDGDGDGDGVKRPQGEGDWVDVLGQVGAK